MHVSDTTTQEPDSGTGISRRSLVRTGATAAWAVPLIQVASAAPALAVSGPAALSIQGFFVKRSGVNFKVWLGGVKNTGGTPTGSVTVVVTFPKVKCSSPPKMVGRVSKGWYVVSDNDPYTFTFQYRARLWPGHKTPSLAFSAVYKFKGAWKSSSKFTAVASAPGTPSTAAVATTE